MLNGLRRNIKKSTREVEGYWKKLGPGLTTGAADDDPSGIATYSQAGAGSGFQLLWLTSWTFPLMAVVQEMCARIGLVTGHGLAANIRKNYSHSTIYIVAALLFIANAFNLGVDLGAMAQAVQLLVPGINFLILIAAFAILCLLLEIFVPYKTYASYLKYLALILFAYVASALMANLDWEEVLRHGFLPEMAWSKKELIIVTAVLGTTISPYLFFWQTSQEVEEGLLDGKVSKKGVSCSPKDIKDMRRDVWIGMFLSNMVAFFIIAASAATLFANGVTDINTASEAAAALRPFAGDAAYFLFALGIIGTGLLSVPILAGSASYAISEAFRWKEGLFRKIKDAYAFYGIIAAATLIGFLVNLLGLDPMKALIWSAVLNAVISPVVLFFIVDLAKDKKVMGKYVSSRNTTLVGWIVTLLMGLAALGTLTSLIFS